MWTLIIVSGKEPQRIFDGREWIKFKYVVHIRVVVIDQQLNTETTFKYGKLYQMIRLRLNINFHKKIDLCHIIRLNGEIFKIRFNMIP